jgi:hypothetical protein
MLFSWKLYPKLKAFISPVTWLCIPWAGKPCWVLEYSALPCDFCWGNSPDDSALPIPWPYPLPDGWSVEWDPSLANADPSEWCHARASMTSALTTCTMPYFKLRCMTWNSCLFCNNFPGWESYVTFKHSFNISACDIKCDGIRISGLAFCGVPCLILHSVVYRDATRQTKRLYRLKHVGARRSGLMYLNRCNSNWYCHS